MQDSAVVHLRTRTPAGRYAILTLIALLGALALTVINLQPTDSARLPRWPTDGTEYLVSGWTDAPAGTESAWGITHVSRGYRRADGVRATLTISTSTEAKGLYKSAADLPYLGSGYTAEQVSAAVVLPQPGREDELVRRNDEAWLLLYQFGERRGLVGNALQRWALVGFDSLPGRPNDYYLLRLALPVSSANQLAVAQAGTDLADILFPRMADWYAQG